MNLVTQPRGFCSAVHPGEVFAAGAGFFIGHGLAEQIVGLQAWLADIVGARPCRGERGNRQGQDRRSPESEVARAGASVAGQA